MKQIWFNITNRNEWKDCPTIDIALIVQTRKVYATFFMFDSKVLQNVTLINMN